MGHILYGAKVTKLKPLAGKERKRAKGVSQFHAEEHAVKRKKKVFLLLGEEDKDIIRKS